MQCFTSICSLLHFMHFLPLIESPHPQDQQCQQHQQCNPTKYRPTNDPTLPPHRLDVVVVASLVQAMGLWIRLQ
ncbi:hypothetical protein Hanom_Chr12g01138421 [Helianthus anomalus]